MLKTRCSKYSWLHPKGKENSKWGGTGARIFFFGGLVPKCLGETKSVARQVELGGETPPRA